MPDDPHLFSGKVDKIQRKEEMISDANAQINIFFREFERELS